MNLLSKRSGFTLIELLTVISIIGILSTILYANFGDARSDARNKVVRAELKEIQLAIELYKAQEGRYPAAEGLCDLVDSGIYMTDTSGGCGTTPFISGLVPDFTAALPTPDDSGNPACMYLYATDLNGTWYKLSAYNCIVAETQAQGVQSTDEMALCPDNGACDLINTGMCQASAVDYYESLSVYSLGGECPSF